METSCLNQKKKEELMSMLYRYKEAFRHRGQIGTYPNMEVEIDVANETPCFIRPYHVKEKDKYWIMK